MITGVKFITTSFDFLKRILMKTSTTIRFQYHVIINIIPLRLLNAYCVAWFCDYLHSWLCWG